MFPNTLFFCVHRIGVYFFLIESFLHFFLMKLFKGIPEKPITILINRQRRRLYFDFCMIYKVIFQVIFTFFSA